MRSGSKSAGVGQPFVRLICVLVVVYVNACLPRLCILYHLASMEGNRLRVIDRDYPYQHPMVLADALWRLPSPYVWRRAKVFRGCISCYQNKGFSETLRVSVSSGQIQRYVRFISIVLSHCTEYSFVSMQHLRAILVHCFGRFKADCHFHAVLCLSHDQNPVYFTLAASLG